MNAKAKYTLWGIALGFAFPLLAWILNILASDLAFTFDSFVKIHQKSSLLFIIDLAPFILGLVFYFLGKNYERALDKNYFPSLLAENDLKGSTQAFKLAVAIALVGLLLFLGTSSWFIQQKIQTKIHEEVGIALDTILATTEQAAYFQLQEEQTHALIWARTKFIVQAAQALMSLQNSRQELIGAPAQTKLRTWFEPIRDTRNFRGFFIISPEGINLASSRDINVGELSVLTKHPNFLEKIWQGDTALNPPHHAHVALPNQEGKQTAGLITMFTGAPIKDESGRIIAALAFRIDPKIGLSSVFKQGRMGRSGETYAFIKEGEIITQSRFSQHFKNYGLTFISADETVHLEVRDPGVNLSLGERTDVPRSKQPFTHMAKSAMAGKAGQDLEGYRDYRGVPVVGSWLWSDRLNFGMTTEIDVAEGYAMLNFSRRILTISTFILGFLILGFAGYFLKYRKESKRSMQILIENEKTTRLLLNSTGEAIYGIDLNGECIFANRTCLGLLGHQSEDKLIGKNMHDLIHHTRKDGAPYPIEECKIFQAFKEGKGTHVTDEVLWRKDGSSFPAEYRSYPIQRHGKIIGSVVSFTDISVRENLVQEIKASQERFQAFFEVSQEGIIFHDQGIISDINPKAEKLLGYEPGELIGQSVLVAVAPDSKEKVIAKIKTQTPASYEIKTQRKDGTTPYVEIMSKTVEFREGTQKVVTFRDITERKLAENKTQIIASELAQLIDFANGPIFGINTRLQINEWNQAAAKLTGYDKEEVMGCLFIHEFIDDPNKEAVSIIFKKAIAGEETANFELILRTKKDTLATVLFNTTTRRDLNGKVTGVIGIGQDITDLRDKENALHQAQKMEAVGQLTGGIAHDFNNLLSIISGNLRFLQQDIGETSVEINELFEDANSAVNDGTNLAQRLLGFSRKRSYQLEIRNVSDTIKKFARFLSRTLGAGVELEIDVPDRNLFIDVDPSQLENSLLNLTINARDAMPQGGKITIKAERYHAGDGDGDGRKHALSLSEDDYIKISITDTGSGISSEDLQRVYEPFFTTKEVGKGSGLGLSMVYAFTQQSDGACYIDSTLGEGTTVSMYFREVMDDQPIGKQKDEKSPPIRGSEVILVVEDEPRVRRVTLRDMKMLGYKTLEAKNADTAKTIIASGKHIDLLFSDVLMPGKMDGYLLGEWTAKNYPEIEVVLTSGFSKQKINVSGDKPYRFPLIRKPYSIEKLALQIRTSLENRTRKRE